MPKGDKREHNSVPRFHTVWTQNRHGPGAFGCAYRSLKSDHIGDAAAVGTRPASPATMGYRRNGNRLF